MQNDETDERWSDDGTDRGAGVNDADGGRSLFGGDPLGDDANSSWKGSALAHAQQEARYKEESEAGGEPMQRTGDRPPEHDNQKTTTGPEAINKTTTADVERGVGEQE